MHVVTFYSYKGGVGRSMALVNVAALLARSGKSVLVVDFDLEAPGLSSYGPLIASAGLPGVLDYVERYRRDLEAPNAAEFITRCAFEDGTPIWIMPAGDNGSPTYTERLGDLDWAELYGREKGYLMFEDLRQQWALHPALFDYVLVDSRTGNTDVGGICTRQLPDAVVAMFIPTEQNIAGLVPMVARIREASRPDGQRIGLHFCASNVPDEYDEDGVLEKRLADARARLGIEAASSLEPPMVTIHHRTSLALLDQGLVVVDRDRSKLAREYGDLRSSIVGANLEDREGALMALERLAKVYDQARRRRAGGQVLNEIPERVREARRLHPEDGEIAARAAEVFSLLGDDEEELAARATAIDAGMQVEASRLRRAAVLLKADRDDEALDDIRRIFQSPESTTFELMPAAQMLRLASKDAVAEARALISQPGVKPRAKVVLAHQLLMGTRADMGLVAEEMNGILREAEMSETFEGDVRNAAHLALVSIGDFAAAAKLRGGNDSIVDLFNDAIAQWGISGSAPIDLFARIDAMPRPPEQDANVRQCYALMKATLGDEESARTELAAARERAAPGARLFSCWTYLYGTGSDLTRDLDEMQALLARGVPLKPPFLDQRDDLKAE